MVLHRQIAARRDTAYGDAVDAEFLAKIQRTLRNPDFIEHLGVQHVVSHHRFAHLVTDREFRICDFFALGIKT